MVSITTDLIKEQSGLSDAAFFLCNFQKFLTQILYFQIPYNTLCLTPTPPPQKKLLFPKATWTCWRTAHSQEHLKIWKQ